MSRQTCEAANPVWKAKGCGKARPPSCSDDDGAEMGICEGQDVCRLRQGSGSGLAFCLPFSSAPSPDPAALTMAGYHGSGKGQDRPGLAREQISGPGGGTRQGTKRNRPPERVATGSRVWGGQGWRPGRKPLGRCQISECLSGGGCEWGWYAASTKLAPLEREGQVRCGGVWTNRSHHPSAMPTAVRVARHEMGWECRPPLAHRSICK
jgi:hypothetical protein